jgi:hypothetical protein
MPDLIAVSPPTSQRIEIPVEPFVPVATVAPLASLHR